MELKQWFFLDFMKYQKSQGQFTTQTQYAEHLGLTQAYLNHLMTGKRKRISIETAVQVAERSGDNSIYEVAGYTNPDGSQLPPGLKSALDGAIDEIERTYKSQGVTDLSSAEALEIAKRIMSEHGFTVTL